METRLKRLRLAKGMSQRGVCAISGLSVSYYSELETGVKPMTKSAARKLSVALDVEEYLLFEVRSSGLDAEFLRDLAALDGRELALIRELVSIFLKD